MDISIGSYKCRLEICILIIIMSWILFGHLLCSCCMISFKEAFAFASSTVKEGFYGANQGSLTNIYANADAPGYINKPKTWSMPTLTYSPGTKPDAGVESILDRQKQPVPLPEGQYDMFATTQFKPECCPNTYSSSSGCACMTVDQYDYLRDRGGNNVPYSEY